MRPSILFPGVFASALLLWAAPALAEDVEEAKRQFDQAETAYKLGKYTEAIAAYEAAYEAMPEPAFLYNIAQAHRKQYNLDKQAAHLHKALGLYKTYLRESKEPQRKQVVQNLIEELKQLISAMEANAPGDAPGKLSMRGELARGGIIEVDGARWGVMPWSGELSPGSHQVTVRKEGYQPWSTSVRVPAGGEMEVSVVLQSSGRAVAGEEDEPAAGETPIYRKWWLWTLVGVVAAGAGVGVGLGVHYAGGGDSVPNLPTIDLR